jgi:hypothetical protein
MKASCTTCSCYSIPLHGMVGHIVPSGLIAPKGRDNITMSAAHRNERAHKSPEGARYPNGGCNPSKDNMLATKAPKGRNNPDPTK